MGKKAQTSFEYLLLGAGVLLLIVIIIVIIRSQVISPINSNVGGGVSNYTSLLNGFNAS